MRAGPIILDTLSMPQIRVSQGETGASFPLEQKLYPYNESNLYSSPDGTNDPDKATLTVSGNNMIIAAPTVN